MMREEGTFKRGVTERGVFAFACQYIVSPRGRTGNRTVTQMRHPLLVEGRPNCARQFACQYTVGTSRRGDIMLRPRSPRKCQYPLFAYPLFKRALIIRRIRCRFVMFRRGQVGVCMVQAYPRERARLERDMNFHLFLRKNGPTSEERGIYTNPSKLLWPKLFRLLIRFLVLELLGKCARAVALSRIHPQSSATPVCPAGQDSGKQKQHKHSIFGPTP